MSQILNGEYQSNETNVDSQGGTEILTKELASRLSKLDNELLEKFQIVSSRVRDLDEDKIRIFWAHDLPGDPESEFLKNSAERNKFHKFVFVSNWQMQNYINMYDLKWSQCVVLENAIEPIEEHTKPDIEKGIRLIYTPTPHRGLVILAPVFEKLVEKYPDLHLDVFSSFELYGWKERDEQYAEVFKRLQDHPNVTYHGSASNQTVREALKNSHIFAYPSIWPETSCLCLMEAMSAGLICVHSNFGALPETSSKWTNMYQIHEDVNAHAGMFYNVLDNAIENYKDEAFRSKVYPMKNYADTFYNWNFRIYEWRALMKALESQVTDTSFPKVEMPLFNYKTS
jgi:UDP-glucose:(glucosyl)LPS alpha-1,2-glucosyltransferase